MTWQRNERDGGERIAVEARYRNFLKGRGQEEPIVLGWVDGPRCEMLHHLADQIKSTFYRGRDEPFVAVDLPEGASGEDIGRRLALMATVLRASPGTAVVDRACQYLEAAPPFEINFWMSKLMDQEVGEERVVPALLLMSRSMRVRASSGRPPDARQRDLEP
jgi:hypothetical protein